MAQLIERLGARAASPAEPRRDHLPNRGGCRRIEFAEAVAAMVGADASLIQGIEMRAQQRPAPRPAYSALTSCHVEQAIGRTLRPWHDALRAYLASQRWLN